MGPVDIWLCMLVEFCKHDGISTSLLCNILELACKEDLLLTAQFVEILCSRYNLDVDEDLKVLENMIVVKANGKFDSPL